MVSVSYEPGNGICVPRLQRTHTSKDRSRRSDGMAQSQKEMAPVTRGQATVRYPPPPEGTQGVGLFREQTLPFQNLQYELALPRRVRYCPEL